MILDFRAANMQSGKRPSFLFSFWFASTGSGLQEARPGFGKSQVSRGVWCSDLLIMPQRGLFGRDSVFLGLVCALVKFQTRGPQALTDAHAQDIQSLPFFVCQKVARTWSWDVSQK